MTEISKLGIIGNCRSAALVTHEGSIVWSCMPDFDSPAVFARLLDEKKGGEMSFICQAGTKITQGYIERTNVLRTHFETPSGNFEMLDFMPIYYNEDGSYFYPPEIYRLIRVLRGKPEIRIRYQPKLNYAHGPTQSTIYDEYIKSVTTKGEYHSIYLYCDLPYKSILEESAIIIEKDYFLLVSFHQKLVHVDYARALLEYERTKVYWINWVNRTQTYPEYQKEIIRSALTLKLLTYQKTGAVIAAVTTSLPEKAGETRNWDYRYCWIRDTSMIIETLWVIRHKNTAKGFLRFLLNTIISKADTLQILYGIRGERKLKERILRHLAGYRDSRPVRVGNDAYHQKQSDVYGVLMDLIHTCFLHFPPSLSESEELWTTVRFIMKTVEDNWQKTDRSIWELRKGPRHFVFSKVLSWVAADKGVAIAKMLDRNDYIEHWTQIRDAIREQIELRGWNEKMQAYTQSYGSDDVDASILLMEKVGYCQPDYPRYVATVRTIYRELCRNGLMYRYKNKDDFGQPGSAFIICTFWMIDALYQTGDKKLARDMFDRLLSYANHLGLFSEDMDFDTHELLGNFPQGYSHLALINTAILLNSETEWKPRFRFTVS